jgi:hypothetical protein
MKISAKILANFINKVCIAGNITDAVLRFEDDGLHISVKDIVATCAVRGILNKSMFQDYVPLRVSIKDSVRMLGALRNMGNSMVSLSVAGNTFCIDSDENTAELIVPDEKYLECNMSPEQETNLFEKLQFDAGFEIASDRLKTVIKNTNMLGVKSVSAYVHNGVFYIRAGEESFDKFTVKIPVNYNDVASRYGTALFEIINVLEGNINVAFGTDFPMMISTANNEFNIKWLASPIIEAQ